MKLSSTRPLRKSPIPVMKRFDNGQRRADDEHQGHEDEADTDVEVGHLGNALFDAEHGRTGVKHGKNHDDDDLNERGLGQSEDGVGPRIQLQRAKAERRGDAAQRGERGENIDDFAERPLDGLLSDQRDEDRTDQTGRVVAELIVGQRHGDNGVTCPGVQPQWKKEICSASRAA